MKKLLFACMYILLTGLCYGQKHILLGVEVAKKELKNAIRRNEAKPNNLVRKIISDKQKAIALAEFYLFDVYGKKQIISERPYEIYLIDGYWVMNGTLPENSDGGGFIIILNSADGAVIKLSHYK